MASIPRVNHINRDGTAAKNIRNFVEAYGKGSRTGTLVKSSDDIMEYILEGDHFPGLD
jgi:hypothetical protein